MNNKEIVNQEKKSLFLFFFCFENNKTFSTADLCCAVLCAVHLCHREQHSRDVRQKKREEAWFGC
jgi:hypothetical protein